MTKIIIYTISNKALEKDEITNDILKIISLIITLHLQRIFNVSIKEDYCSKHFRNLIIITLRKLNKSSYVVVSFYRSITLFNIIDKIIKFIIIRRITYLVETHKLLLITHIRTRKAMFTEHALHYVMKKVHSVWNDKKIALILLLNIIKAFNNVFRERLIYNLRTKRINERIIRWIENFLSNRTTILKTSKHITIKVNISVEISQKSSFFLWKIETCIIWV